MYIQFSFILIHLPCTSLYCISLYFFVSTVLFKEPGSSPPVRGPEPNRDQTGEDRNAPKVSRGVLDFSSGSEDDDEEEQGHKKKGSNRTAVDRNVGGNAATDPGRMSLLQHGFSRLLERIKGKGLGEGDSSASVEESPSEEDAEDQKREGTSSGICKSSNRGNCPKLGVKTWRVSSDKEDRKYGGGGRQERVFLGTQSDDTVKTVNNSDENSSTVKKKPNEVKTKVQKVHLFEFYSDESEDLNIEVMTKPKRDIFSHSRGDKVKGRLDQNEKKQSTGVRNKARLKYSEDIDTFTSSEDEHNPVKKGRSAGCHFKSPRTERSRVELPKDEQSATTANSTERRARMSKAVSFTNLKSQTSPASKRKDGTIDSVLGQIKFLLL